MGTPNWLDKRNWWVVLVALALVGCMSLLLGFKRSPSRVSAHAETVFGPACGKAEIGGVVDPIEWNNASVVQRRHEGFLPAFHGDGWLQVRVP